MIEEGIREVVVDDDLDVLEVESVQPETQTNHAEQEPAKTEGGEFVAAEPAKAEEVQAKKPEESPSDRAFAALRVANRENQRKLEEAQRKLEDYESKFKDRVAVDKSVYEQFLSNLQLEDPEAYQRELLRQNNEDLLSKLNSRIDELRAPKAQEQAIDLDEYTAVAHKTDAAITSRFPNVLKEGTAENGIFTTEISKRLNIQPGDTPQAINDKFAAFVVNNSEAVVTLAELAHLRARTAEANKANADNQRQARIATQGVSSSPQKSNPTTLTPEEIAFAKRNGWTAEEFQKFNAGGSK